MTDLTNFAKARILDHFMRREFVSPPLQWYVGLYIDATGDDESGTEVFAPGYVRQPVLFGPVVGENQSRSSVAVTFPPAGANWGIVTHFALHDAAEGGHMWFHGPLDNDLIVEEGEEFVFNVEGIIVVFE